MIERTREPLVVTINEAATLLSVDRSTIYRLIERGIFRPAQVGERKRIRMSEIRAYVNEHDGLESETVPDEL